MVTTTRRGWVWLCLWLAAWFSAACGGPLTKVELAGSGPGQAAQATPTVLAVTLAGKLGTPELARVHRTLREAKARGLRVLFRLQDAGAFGEDAGELQSVYDHLLARDVETIALLSGRVTDGAAALALCCDEVWCLQNVAWGEVEKPEGELGELLADQPEAERDARCEAAAQAMASRLQKRRERLRPDAEKMALAMADPRVQLITATVREGGLERARILTADEVTALQAAGAVLLGDEKLPRPLVVTAAQAEAVGLSRGTLQNQEQLAELRGLDKDAIGELTGNWAESMAGWLELLQPFLLIAGFLLLLIEVKTPGVGLPGFLGVGFLGLAFFYSHLVGLADWTEILLFFLGLAAIAVEIFLLPGTVVFGAIGFVMLVVALVLSRQSFVLPSNTVEEELLLANLGNLILLFVVVLVAAAVVWRMLPKLPWTNRMLLAPPEPASASSGPGGGGGRGSADDRLLALVGRVGLAATVLRPGGTMELDGERFDVVTEGEFVEPGTRVRVLYVQGSRVVVGAERAGERGASELGLVVLLCTIGVLLIVAEVMFVSFGAIGFLAAAALFGAVFVAFQQSFAFGVTMVIVETVVASATLALSFKLLPKTRIGKALILAAPSSPGPIEADDVAQLRGQRGRTLTSLRPAGHARIAGRKVDVTTRGELIDADTDVTVLDVQGTRVVVAAISSSPSTLPRT